jgi:Flp pilus assembly protein TadD
MSALFFKRWVALMRFVLASSLLCASGMVCAQSEGACARRQTVAAHRITLPLTGAAYRVAQQAYAAYERADYAAALAQAREAIRQRPDVASLRLLLANILAAQRRYRDASRALREAIAQFGLQPELATRRRQIDTLSASAHPVARAGHSTQASNTDALSGAAFAAAQQAYSDYDARRFSSAAGYARDAIALRPDVLRLRLLLIDAASAAGRDADAWQADLDAVNRFRDDEALRVRRGFIGGRLAPKASAASYAARKRGDDAQAASLARDAVVYAPDQIAYRLQLIDALFASNDLDGAQAAAAQAMVADDTAIMPLMLHGYTLAAQGRHGEADADFAKALYVDGATVRDQRIARVIIADVWIAGGQPQRALDLLEPLSVNGDDTDPPIALRRARARQLIAQQRGDAMPDGAAALHAAGAARPLATPVDPERRPRIDCQTDAFGVICNVYAADAGFSAARASAAAAAAKDRAAAVAYAREAVRAAPDDPQHRVELINALGRAGDERDATREAEALVSAGMLDALPDLSAAYIAQRAGDYRLAYQRFSVADKAGALPAGAAADAGYAAVDTHHNDEAARYFERAIDASAESAAGDTPSATPVQVDAMRGAHAEATRNWGFNASLNYRGAGLQPGYTTSSTPATSNNWQAGVEAYWRPFGSLGDRLFELYARGYESFGLKDNEPSGKSTLQADIGARARPFSQVDAIVAFERVIPIGSQVRPDWLARLAYSGGVGTARRMDVPSWWTAQVYAETGAYLDAGTAYATTSIELGRTYRMDRYSPRWTVFPYAVIGASYDSSVDRSIPVGAGVGVSTRFWFRDSRYDAPRSYVDLSLQYRLRLAGDDRARGFFFGTVYSF